jgi:hypothetical protein
MSESDLPGEKGTMHRQFSVRLVRDFPHNENRSESPLRLVPDLLLDTVVSLAIDY